MARWFVSEHCPPCLYPAYGGPHALVSSPRVGCSILITSALEDEQRDGLARQREENRRDEEGSPRPIDESANTRRHHQRGWINIHGDVALWHTLGRQVSAYNTATQRHGQKRDLETTGLTPARKDGHQPKLLSCPAPVCLTGGRCLHWLWELRRRSIVGESGPVERRKTKN